MMMMMMMIIIIHYWICLVHECRYHTIYLAIIQLSKNFPKIYKPPQNYMWHEYNSTNRDPQISEFNWAGNLAPTFVYPCSPSTYLCLLPVLATWCISSSSSRLLQVIWTTPTELIPHPTTTCWLRHHQIWCPMWHTWWKFRSWITAAAKDLHQIIRSHVS